MHSSFNALMKCETEKINTYDYLLGSLNRRVPTTQFKK